MKHIESSKRIALAAATDAATVKYSLVERLRGAFHVETVGECTENFTVVALGRDTPYRCTLHVDLKADDKYARLMVDGEAAIGASTKVSYALGVLALLILGLFPGTINTSGRGSAIDVMVFLFLGIFVIYDINRKMMEPEALLDRVLQAVETEFGV
jgi:hypothetical protein